MKNQTIWVALDHQDCLDCPFISDLNSCNATKGSGINSCPVGYEDEKTGMYMQKPADFCPLRKGCVTVEAIA